MNTNLSFKEVCEYIKNDNLELVDEVEKLLGVGLIFSSVLAAPYLPISMSALSVLSGMLGVKGEISKISKRVFQKVVGKKDNDPVMKLRRMAAAYTLICFTAYFETFEKSLPEIAKSLKLKSTEKLAISQSALEAISKAKDQSAVPLNRVTSIDVFEMQLGLPHPTGNLATQKRQLGRLYKELTENMLSFIKCLVVWESIREEQRRKIQTTLLGTLPEQVFERFRAQYYVLATQYEEFYVWSNLYEHDDTKNRIKQLSAYTQKIISLAKSSQNRIDVGLIGIAEALQNIPAQIETKQANRIFEELERLYSAAIEEPIIKATAFSDDEEAGLTYPKKSQIFIPPAFKVIRYTGKERLEDERTWKPLATRNDLEAFLLSYLSSPYSVLTPLIIVGYPGSGKSLLVNMLAARLAFSIYTPVIVVLRDVNADTEIAAQIEQQINSNTGRSVSWANLADHFQERPPLVLLDGYDELLQASGSVYSGYLTKVQKFQENESALGRQSVRTLVTSRITLIDKAEIPKGATVVRLMEFDKPKRNTWISIWNSTNQRYFIQKQIRPFELPESDKRINELGEQPLLLMMLALYDSEGNQLRQKKGLDQTVLYDSLLRQFVERERGKGPRFQNLPEKDKVKEVEKEIERLGVAAIGMFNRRLLHITTKQLDDDLTFFRLERKTPESGGRRLSQAELLLGSFFFIYESKSVKKDDQPGEYEVDTAFEFLHNTFGEFLATDFILRKVLAETHSIHKLRKDEVLLRTLEQKLSSADGFSKEWFACFMFTPLFTRPVILDMMRTWVKHLLEKIQIEDFLTSLDIIISNQIRRTLNSNALPSIMTGTEKTPFRNLPLVGHAAIYTLNLVTLRTILSPDGYIFDETTIPQSEDGTRTWERLTHLWRSWFSLESLEGLTAILVAKREDTQIYVQLTESFTTPRAHTRLDSIRNVSMSLADYITAALSGLLTYDSFRDSPDSLAEIGQMLEAENIDLEAELTIKRIRIMQRQGQKFTLWPLLRKVITRPPRVGNMDTFVSLIREARRAIPKLEDEDILRFVWELTNYSLWDITNVPEVMIEIIGLVKDVDSPVAQRELLEQLLRRSNAFEPRTGRHLIETLMESTFDSEQFYRIIYQYYDEMRTTQRPRQRRFLEDDLSTFLRPPTLPEESEE